MPVLVEFGPPAKTRTSTRPPHPPPHPPLVPTNDKHVLYAKNETHPATFHFIPCLLLNNMLYFTRGQTNKRYPSSESSVYPPLPSPFESETPKMCPICPNVTNFVSECAKYSLIPHSPPCLPPRSNPLPSTHKPVKPIHSYMVGAALAAALVLALRHTGTATPPPWLAATLGTATLAPNYPATAIPPPWHSATLAQCTHCLIHQPSQVSRPSQSLNHPNFPRHNCPDHPNLPTFSIFPVPSVPLSQPLIFALFKFALFISDVYSKLCI